MILVTGATGNVGSQVLQQLRAAGHPVRAFVRDGETAARRFGGGVEIAVGDLNRPETLEAALRGIDRLYLLAPLTPELQQQEANAIEAATRAGVQREGQSRVCAGSRPRAYPVLAQRVTAPASAGTARAFWQGELHGRARCAG